MIPPPWVEIYAPPWVEMNAPPWVEIYAPPWVEMDPPPWVEIIPPWVEIPLPPWVEIPLPPWVEIPPCSSGRWGSAGAFAKGPKSIPLWFIFHAPSELGSGLVDETSSILLVREVSTTGKVHRRLISCEESRAVGTPRRTSQ
jgi:hypothetical protein